ncbi:DUF488 domain-containing protein [Prevotella lacticifex]|uniref:DUF488 domain-containing protein n=1 Tax=Prevotella lacticifex TaxID=2854755 RepID=A0A9R1C7N0_9BACT|nr:DUF488 domain-containing protein [Prevotella lacticifex]GJG37264.1 hypothetical protein PRLR5003_24210 [Prevotella lacticifex]GJG40236.1 hypothetical protein PRLR5019_22070 [Prevotella lacticifex]GJG43930.1 hypothetical protein PRLR5025_27160 [Prevotella lacticifex]GJG46614.1 hypothetical protein PRLR5027_22090 [Prevotella lacticifex]GJG50766.1 hypothetical protein PRLR5052_31790 [Prevotella lacticifex]
MLTYKKKIILALIEKLGRKDITAKCLQKYLFIYTRISDNKIYDFVPYRYGCFSFEANKDIVSLSKGGYIYINHPEHAECSYELIHRNSEIIENLSLFDNMAIDKVVKKYGTLSSDELITYTYRTWPFTAINSEIKYRLLNSEELARVQAFKDRYKKTETILYTIGYEGLTLEKYLTQLITNDVKVLVDVRKNAFSMKYGFSKATLKKAVEGIGVQYIHVPQLGIESEDRKTLNSQEDYDRLFEIYENTTLIENWDSLLYVRKLLDKEKRICLACFERDPRQCHRTRVANALMGLPDVNYKYEPIIL